MLCKGLNGHKSNFLHSPASSSIQDLFTFLGTLFSSISISARNIKLPVCIRWQKVQFFVCVSGKIKKIRRRIVNKHKYPWDDYVFFIFNVFFCSVLWLNATVYMHTITDMLNRPLNAVPIWVMVGSHIITTMCNKIKIIYNLGIIPNCILLLHDVIIAKFKYSSWKLSQISVQ